MSFLVALSFNGQFIMIKSRNILLQYFIYTLLNLKSSLYNLEYQEHSQSSEK